MESRDQRISPAPEALERAFGSLRAMWNSFNCGMCVFVEVNLFSLLLEMHPH
jgi:hypothetical protein